MNWPLRDMENVTKGIREGGKEAGREGVGREALKKTEEHLLRSVSGSYGEGGGCMELTRKRG